MSHEYKINEIFYSLQGEGARAGSANVFIRFSNCNLRCTVEQNGFDCDTEFISGKQMGLSELVEAVVKIGGKCRSVIFTGGEPGLSLNDPLIAAFKKAGYYLAVESNGTVALPEGLDWICISPKTALHTLKVKKGNEIKFVRNLDQMLPPLSPEYDWEHKWISPAFRSDGLAPEVLAHCIQLIKENPEWKLSTQQHKIWKVR
jgi:7-carboxy-7-deazaguanine synthase